MYRHTQFGWVIVLSLLGALILCSILAWATVPAAGYFLWPTSFILIVCLLLFFDLTVEVDPTRLHFRFGLGLIRKTIPLNRITAARPIRLGMLAGWGIHYGPNGWLYNVSGFGAVEIELVDDKRLCIGSDEPERLAEAIRQAVPFSAPR